MIRLFPINMIMRFLSGAQRGWFRLRVNAPHGVIPWLRWALAFKQRREVRAWLSECEKRIAANFDGADIERMSQELVCFGRAEIRATPRTKGAV